jgi:acyl-coenzyme A thioesterase PaaI-like protein
VSDAFFRAGRVSSGSAQLEQLVATEHAIGPWSVDALHGGPPAALLVRACERAVRAETDADLVALRAGVDFLAPVPPGPLEVRSRVLRGGRRVALAEAVLLADGLEVLLARTWLLRTASRRPTQDHPGTTRSHPGTTGDHPGAGRDQQDDLAGPGRPGTPGAAPLPQVSPPVLTDWTFPYARAVEWRLVHGNPTGPGDAAVWARQRIRLVEDEDPSGLQRAVVVADSGNGISAALDWDRWSFVNVDLAVHLSRPLDGEWVLLDAHSRYEPGGTGLATSALSDAKGTVGTGAQTLLVTPRPR